MLAVTVALLCAGSLFPAVRPSSPRAVLTTPRRTRPLLASTPHADGSTRRRAVRVSVPQRPGRHAELVASRAAQYEKEVAPEPKVRSLFGIPLSKNLDRTFMFLGIFLLFFLRKCVETTRRHWKGHLFSPTATHFSHMSHPTFSPHLIRPRGATGKVICVRPPHPFLPYVAPHFSHAAPLERSFVFAHRTHFSHMSHPTFPTSDLFILFF